MFLGQAEISDPQLWEKIKKEFGARETVPMLPWAGIVGKETRRLYFNQAVVDGKFSKEAELKGSPFLPINRLISYGDCNMSCPYCKRDCQFIDDKGNVLSAVEVSLDEVLKLCLWAIGRGETPRFSGGDPVSFKRETLAIAKYCWEQYDMKVSIAHNGTWGQSIERLVPYLSSAAIDLKAVPSKLGKVMDIRVSAGEPTYAQSLKTQALISHAGVLLDVRTPIFGDTTLEDMMVLGADICRTNDLSKTFWTWRLYKEVEGCDWLVPEVQKVIEMMQIVSKQLPELWMGMRAKWQAGGMIYVKDGMIIDRSDGSDVEKTGSGNQDLVL